MKLRRNRKETTWSQRLKDLRGATGWTQIDLQPFLGISIWTIRYIEQKGGRDYRPDLQTIGAIRRLEKAFAWELTRYRRNPSRYGRIVHNGSNNTRKLPPLERPRDEVSYREMGGPEAFRHLSPASQRIRHLNKGVGTRFKPGRNSGRARTKVEDIARFRRAEAGDPRQQSGRPAPHTRARRIGELLSQES